MTRWPPGAAQRLHDAAMELFVEQGFAATTVPQIAERAGLTTRTFFRWYLDKREVLFAGEEGLPDVVAAVFAGSPAELEPTEVVRFGFHAVLDDLFEQNRAEMLARWQIVRTDEGLRERQSRKLAVLQDAAKRGFSDRGLAPPDAALAARIAIALHDETTERWLAGDGRRFAEVGDDVIDAFRRLFREPS